MTRASRVAVALGGVIAVLTLPAVVLAAAPAAPRQGPPPIPTYTFVSAPNLHPPKLQVLHRNAGVAPGDFIAASTGLLLMDDHVRPVWFLPVKSAAFDLQQETYDGQPVLVWFDGGIGVVRRGRRPPRIGRNPGEVVIYNEHYRKIAALKARSPWMTDLHDASITGGDIWISVTRTVNHLNLKPYGGRSNGTVLDVGLQEFQISTGKLMRTWDALNPGGKPNVPLSASEERPAGGWDAYHLNSVQALPDGDLLVSMRNTWSVYLIDPRTDTTIWTLGGKDSTFKLGPGASFAWQHDARVVDPAQNGQGANVKLTLFNDNNGGRGSKPSAGLVLSLNTTSHAATLVSAYFHHPPLSAQVLGSMQLLPDGDALVGWGSEPYFSEYTASGRLLLDVRWPGGSSSYRTLFTNSWVGTPYYPPSGAVRGSTVYASWNGATLIAKWEVLAGSSVGALKVIAARARTGFETAIKVGKGYAVYEVRAMSGTGQVLGTSKAFS